MGALVQTLATLLALITVWFGEPKPSFTSTTISSTQIALYSRTSTLVHANPARVIKPVPSEYVLVNRVIDGDTIELETGEKVRYIGINTPESVDPRRGVQCFGQEASAYNKAVVVGKNVRLVKDVSNTDKYGRLLRYVYLPDGTFVNLTLVQNGYARASTFPPDVKYSKTFMAAEREAREAGRGLWSGCP
jgi:endonuclease YncB( thermonuclease family)